MKNKANFIIRLSAFLIDMLLVVCISFFLTSGISNKKVIDLNQEYSNVLSSYSSGEMTQQEYNTKMIDITYDMNKNAVVSNIMSLLLSIIYFVFFQFFNKGQTIGKKLTGIKVLENGKEPSLKALIIRTLIINGILTSALTIILVYFLGKEDYYIATLSISMIEYLFIFVSAFMILYRKDKKGLHDLMANTEVVKE